MAKIMIVGAHGKVALLLGQRLSGDHEVSGLVRQQGQFEDLRAAGVNPRLLDVGLATESEFIDAFDGHDAVVFAAGAGGGDVARTYAIDRDASIRSANAAHSAGIRRYVLLSSIGAGHPENLPDESDYLTAKGAADEHLSSLQGLRWTIVRPGYLSDDAATGRVSIGESAEQWDGPSIPRGDVAHVLAATLSYDNTVGKIVVAFGGDTDIDGALADV